jgi:hypothetical protein
MIDNPRVIAAPHDFRSAKNSSGATIAKGRVVKLKTTGTDDVILPTAIGDAVFGVVTADIPDGAVGTVQVRGRALVLIGTGGVTAGDKLTHDTGGFGRVSTAAPAAGTNNALVGLATRTEATAGTLSECELCGPGVFFQG